jgi:hypothetical protein
MAQTQHFTPVVLGTWKNGRPIYLAMGGEESGDAAAQAAKAAADAAAAAAAANEPKFPASTPVAEMTADQRAEYYKHHSREHERTKKEHEALLRKLGVRTEAEADALLEAKKAADKARKDGATDVERARIEATEAAEAAAAESRGTLLVETAFEIAIGDRKTDDEIKSYLEELNLSKFLTADGKVDKTKVLARVQEFAPDKGISTTRRGPVGDRHGPGGGSADRTSGGGGSVKSIMAERQAAREAKK